MGQEYSMEVVERAEELYCVEGHTFDAVATLTGVAASTLKRWSDRYNWQEKKEEIRQALSSIRANTIKLRAKLIENCLNTLNAQDAFAVSAIEGLAQRATQIALKQPAAPAVENLREIKTDEDAITALEEAIQIKLNSMLTNPGQVSLASVKEIKTVSEFISGMRAKVSKTDAGAGKRKGLSADAADQLRREILGIKQ
jgi:transposase